ncbi:MAG: nickel transporter permease [Symbiobacterium sp.]|uniref:nickel transporter permease n=1 Tax=Symbiobacterium sp. TaxID=1971213 RepID=UPI0034648536
MNHTHTLPAAGGPGSTPSAGAGYAPRTGGQPGPGPHPSGDADFAPSGSGPLRRFLRHRAAVLGGLIVLTIVLTALLADVIAPYDPIEGRLVDMLQPPSRTHWMGTDEQGRDIFSRIIHGSRISLQVGLVAVGISLTTGTAIGAISAYFGGWPDLVVMRIIDILLAFPSILLAIAITAILGPSLTNAMIAVGIVGMPVYARLVRASVLSIKEQDYVQAALAAGGGHGRILFRHILPNALAPLIVQSTLSIGTAMLDAAGLSFLGLGARPPTPEWGAMLSGAQVYIQLAPWVVTFPGLAIMLAVLGFNLLGDGLRDVLDPRLRR